MIELYVNGIKAEIKKNTSVELTFENRIFANADGYSMDIELPISGSGSNIAIFGEVTRPEADIDSMQMDAELITDFGSYTGSISIISIYENGLKVQFLEGRSAQNNNTKFEDTYICDLNFLPAVKAVTAGRDCGPMLLPYTGTRGDECVAMPWMRTSGANVFNKAVKNGATWEWGEETTQVSVAYYLPVVIKKLFEELGYTANIKEIEDSKYKNLAIFNCAPTTINVAYFSKLLPKWSINEFLEQLELFMSGEFDVNHITKQVSFKFTKNAIELSGEYAIKEITDTYTEELTAEPNVPEFMKNIQFAENGDPEWNIKSCDWLIKQRKKNPESSSGWVLPGTEQVIGPGGHRGYPDTAIRHDSLVYVDTMAALKNIFGQYEWFDSHRNNVVADNIYYVKETGSYFIFHAVASGTIPGTTKTGIHYEILPINEFGMYCPSGDYDKDTATLKIVPAPLIQVEIDSDKRIIALDFKSGDNSALSAIGDVSEESGSIDTTTIAQPAIYQDIINHTDSTSEYYSKLYAGFWTGDYAHTQGGSLVPVLSNVHIKNFWEWTINENASMRINDSFSRGTEMFNSIDLKRCFKFSFVDDEVPSPRAVYWHKGQRYLCKELKIKVGVDEKSRLISGSFYRF